MKRGATEDLFQSVANPRQYPQNFRSLHHASAITLGRDNKFWSVAMQCVIPFWCQYFMLSWVSTWLSLDCFLAAGSTGKPKGVVISHSAIIVQSLAKVAIVGYNETDV